MNQYHNNSSIQPAVNSVTEQEKQTRQHEKTLNDLSRRIDQQAVSIQDLQRQVKKLTNELRLAVNAFNLR
jgi:uncharacterized coiled-coil protein SlyX